jgi:DNA-binding NarL/FixJ family response regulator
VAEARWREGDQIGRIYPAECTQLITSIDEQMNDSQAPAIRVFIVSDNHIIRSGLRRILDSQPSFRVVAEVSIEKTGDLDTKGERADLVLVELDPRATDAFAFIDSLKDKKSDLPVLVLCDLADHELSRKALALGAAGVVLKMQPPAVLIAAIQELCPRAGHRSSPKKLATQANGRSYASHAEGARNIKSLTVREREIIRLVGRGMKNKEIANRLSISDITVRHHLTSIFCKLDIEDRQKLLILAHHWGLADLALSNEST